MIHRPLEPLLYHLQKSITCQCFTLQNFVFNILLLFVIFMSKGSISMAESKPFLLTVENPTDFRFFRISENELPPAPMTYNKSMFQQFIFLNCTYASPISQASSAIPGCSFDVSKMCASFDVSTYSRSLIRYSCERLSIMSSILKQV